MKYEDIETIIKNYETIPRQYTVSPEEKASDDLMEMLRYMRKEIVSGLEEEEEQIVLQNGKKWSESVEIVKNYFMNNNDEREK